MGIYGYILNPLTLCYALSDVHFLRLLPSQMIMTTRCPGEFCGRVEHGLNNYSECGACPRGFRADFRSVCVYCDGRPELYDWLYLGFMTLLPLVLHWFCIDNVSPLVGK